MYERLKNKNEVPTIEECIAHIETCKELFETVDTFLLDEIKSLRKIGFSAHDRCWGMGYHVKRKFICSIYFEKDAFMVVTRLNEDDIKKMYDNVSVYAKESIDNSPFRHRGWIEYRVLNTSHLEDAKIILHVRADCRLYFFC